MERIKKPISAGKSATPSKSTNKDTNEKPIQKKIKLETQKVQPQTTQTQVPKNTIEEFFETQMNI